MKETFPTANFQPRSNATPGIAAQARARTGAKDFLISNSLPLDPRRVLQGEIDFSSVQFNFQFSIFKSGFQYLKSQSPQIQPKSRNTYVLRSRSSSALVGCDENTGL